MTIEEMRTYVKRMMPDFTLPVADRVRVADAARAIAANPYFAELQTLANRID